ncbi:hypothetical protein FF38_09660 [Lucilia cuprina]|uniref:Uncharacterized protein n=1 Tax=Lucilia cuprina TaxID=7375 RepID=A0A0L0BX36_LUCCU|nr:hypothetical protein FF38_09660 [Lucilia cuprina]
MIVFVDRRLLFCSGGVVHPFAPTSSGLVDYHKEAPTVTFDCTFLSQKTNKICTTTNLLIVIYCLKPIKFHVMETIYATITAPSPSAYVQIWIINWKIQVLLPKFNQDILTIPAEFVLGGKRTQYEKDITIMLNDIIITILSRIVSCQMVFVLWSSSTGVYKNV